MPALQVRDFPQDLYSKLQLCANEEHRSISQQTIAIIEYYMRDKEHKAATPLPSELLAFNKSELEVRAQKRKDIFARISEREPVGGLVDESLVAFLQANRDERMDRAAAVFGEER